MNRGFRIPQSMSQGKVWVRNNNRLIQVIKLKSFASDDEVETVLSDGSREVKYSNGNVKTTSPDGNLIKTKYFNGDHKETNLTEGYIKYFYEETKAWQTTYADGTEILEFPK